MMARTMSDLNFDLAPDGFTGAIMAVEGIRDAAVLLNGPTGCKFYHGAMSDGQLLREASMDPLQFADEFYFGQPRVPATYLNNMVRHRWNRFMGRHWDLVRPDAGSKGRVTRWQSTRRRP